MAPRPLPMAPRPLPQSWSTRPPTIAHYNGTLQWHHVHSTIAHYNGTLQWHPAMAPRPLNQSWSSPSPPTIAQYNGTLQWHHVHSTVAHYNGTLQWHHVHSTKVGRHPPPNHSTLQWRPTNARSNGTTSTAPCNGTLQRHPAMAPGPLNHSTLQWHPAMAPRPLNHSTLQWHPAMAPRPLHPAMAFWCHVQCAKVVRRPPPLLEVRTPIAIAIWGKGVQIKAHHEVSRFKWSVFFCFCLWYFDLVKLSLQRYFVDRSCPRFLAQGSLCQTLARMPPRRISSLSFFYERNSIWKLENPLEKSVWTRVQCIQRICGAVAVAGGATGRTGRRRLLRFGRFRRLRHGKLQHDFCFTSFCMKFCLMLHVNYVKCSPKDGPDLHAKLVCSNGWCSNLDDSS